jgi:hypothetical protein
VIQKVIKTFIQPAPEEYKNTNALRLEACEAFARKVEVRFVFFSGNF